MIHWEVGIVGVQTAGLWHWRPGSTSLGPVSPKAKYSQLITPGAFLKALERWNVPSDNERERASEKTVDSRERDHSGLPSGQEVKAEANMEREDLTIGGRRDKKLRERIKPNLTSFLYLCSSVYNRPPAPRHAAGVGGANPRHRDEFWRNTLCIWFEQMTPYSERRSR